MVYRNSLKRFLRCTQVNHVVLADGGLDGQGHLELPRLPGAEEMEGVDTRNEEARKALTESQRKELDELLEEFASLFTTTPGLTTETSMEINTGDNKPVSLHPYRIPVRWRDKLGREVQTLLQLRVIERSKSPWAVPAVCVAKPDGSLRLCVDFRALNRVTATDPTPSPA